MGKMPDALRETIARNIRDCRIKKFPGRGGGKRCAETFGVSPQQWSPWESGKRTPDELRLEQIAAFFETTVEWFRRDHRDFSSSGESANGISPEEGRHILRSHSIASDHVKPRPGMPPFAGTSTEDDMNHYIWLVDILTKKLTANGVKIVVTFERNNSTFNGM